MADGLPWKGESRAGKVWPSDQSPNRRRRGRLRSTIWVELGVELGFGIGWPKGGPSVAQGARRGHASVEWKKWLCLQQKA